MFLRCIMNVVFNGKQLKMGKQKEFIKLVYIISVDMRIVYNNWPILKTMTVFNYYSIPMYSKINADS